MSAPDVSLHRFRWWHIGQVLPWEQKLFGPWAWSAETYWSELAAPGRQYQVACDPAGQVCGWVGLAVTGADADVQTIAVTPRGRGTGLGNRLLTWLIHQAGAAGASQVMLEVRADNEPAKKLYARCGFSEFGVRPRYYQPGDVDALLMRLRVADAVADPAAPELNAVTTPDSATPSAAGAAPADGISPERDHQLERDHELESHHERGQR